MWVVHMRFLLTPSVCTCHNGYYVYMCTRGCLFKFLMSCNAMRCMLNMRMSYIDVVLNPFPLQGSRDDRLQREFSLYILWRRIRATNNGSNYLRHW